MQQEKLLESILTLLEQQGLSGITLENVAHHLDLSLDQLQAIWPDREALLYDCLSYHARQIEAWRQRVREDAALSLQQKLLMRYQVLEEAVSQKRYPGCLFIAACNFYPSPAHPLHQLAEQQKKASWQYCYELLTELDVDNPTQIAEQLELILEGCLNKLLVKRQPQDIHTARLLAEDVLEIAICRKNGALA